MENTGPVFIVVNAGSGRDAADEKIAQLEEGFGPSGRPYTIHVARDGSHVPETAERAARDARAANGILVVAGGDGTINAVGQLAVRDQVPFGIVPEGTFNYLSRTHGIPQETPDAIANVLHGVVRGVQAGMLNDRMFFVNGSLGLYPRLLEDREAYKRRFGRNRLVAVWSAIVTMMSQSRQLEIDIEADGISRHVRTPTLFVGNNRLQLEQVGIANETALDRGQLMAITAAPLTVALSFKLLIRGFLGKLGEAPEVSSFAFRSLTAQTRDGRRRRLKIATDGEVAYVRCPIVFQPSDKPLLLIVPADAPAPADATDAAVVVETARPATGWA